MVSLPTTEAEGAAANSSESPPSRLSRIDALIVIAAVIPLGLLSIAPSRITWLSLATLTAALTGIGVRRRCAVVVHSGLLSTLILGALAAFGSGSLWPLPAVLGAGVYLGMTKLVGPLGGVPGWLRRGRLDVGVGALILASSVISAVALVSWFALTRPDYAGLRGTLLPNLPLPLLFVGVVLFSMGNGALEEFVYRGAVMSALDKALGAGIASLLLQAVLFGLIHYGGFPRGVVGAALATIYGLMMGIVRRRADGMLAPWIAHVFADITIGSILLKALF